MKRDGGGGSTDKNIERRSSMLSMRPKMIYESHSSEKSKFNEVSSISSGWWFMTSF